jgi:hypothetical protein
MTGRRASVKINAMVVAISIALILSVASLSVSLYLWTAKTGEGISSSTGFARSSVTATSSSMEFTTQTGSNITMSSTSESLLTGVINVSCCIFWRSHVRPQQQFHLRGELWRGESVIIYRRNQRENGKYRGEIPSRSFPSGYHLRL